MTNKLEKVVLNWANPELQTPSDRDLEIMRATSKHIASRVRESYSIKYADIQNILKLINEIDVSSVMSEIDV